MSEDYKSFEQEPTPITYILMVLGLVDRSLKEGYVVATAANLAELTKNCKAIREASSVTDLIDTSKEHFSERLS